ncbi:MAG: right-handed parallel beta-helix repeat-containing protein, partial [Candidatus Bipolaricaulota bacterium]|nr:right-handed parallel beta-helix repeat-containing protein [Candidatus Bipolaricaulota bacterium]
VWAMALVVTAVVSAGLVGGQVGGFLWWGTREPIYIYGDDEFTYSNGVMSGSGAAADPYIIEGWNISPANADYGVYVDHTTSHFVIRDCVIGGARIAGLYFNSVENGRIEKVQIFGSDAAIYMLNARDNRIAESVISECRYGVVMAAMSQENVITGNSFLGNGIAGYDPEHRNTWYEGKSGNYWSDYQGADLNKDGVGDEPYYPLEDLRPLMTSPVALTEVAPAGPSYAGNLVAPDGSLVVTSQTPITLVASDPGSGLAEIKYSIDGGPWTTYTGAVLLRGDDGLRKVAYYGIDRLGNAEPKKTVSFLLDNHSPQTVMEIGDPKFADSRGTWITSATRITLRRTQESTYGRTQTYYRINDGAWLTYSTPFRVTGEDGVRAVSFYSRNASGVVEAVQTKIVMKDDAPPTSRGARAQAPGGASIGVEAPTATTASAGSSSGVTAASTSTTKPVTAVSAPTASTSSTTTAPAGTSASTSTTSGSSLTGSSTPQDATAQAALAGAALGQTGTGSTTPSTTQTESLVTPPVVPPSVTQPGPSTAVPDAAEAPSSSK